VPAQGLEDSRPIGPFSLGRPRPTRALHVLPPWSKWRSGLSERVEGTNVFNTAGDKLGSIDDLMIDKRSGQVRYAVMAFGGFLGMGTDRYPLPWDMREYDTWKDGYVVPLDKDRLDNAPKYAQEARPDYDEDHGRRVNDDYGVPYL
jgi:PRC-barrel domain